MTSLRARTNGEAEAQSRDILVAEANSSAFSVQTPGLKVIKHFSCSAAEHEMLISTEIKTD